MLKNEGDRLTRVIVCPPVREYFNVNNLENHNFLDIPDKNAAVKQHKILRSILNDAGCHVISITELPGHPNSVFTRDAALVTPGGYIKLRPGIKSRLKEGEWMADFLDKLNEPCIGKIQKPGTVDGGDIFVSNSVVFAANSGRTNLEGIKQLTPIFETYDYEVRYVKIPDTYLHLDQVMGILGPEKVICCSGLFPQDFFNGFDVIEAPCEDYNLNFICIGKDEIIIPESNRELKNIAEENNITFHTADLSEFAKGSGGPNCLIMPLERVKSDYK